MLEALGPDVDVRLPRLHDVLRHRLEPAWPEHAQGTFPPLDPRGEDEIRVADRVIGMEVRDERRPEADRREPLHALFERGLGTPDDARSGVDEIWRSRDDDRGRGARSLRFRPRRAGAEENDLGSGAARVGALRVGRMDGEHDEDGNQDPARAVHRPSSSLGTPNVDVRYGM